MGAKEAVLDDMGVYQHHDAISGTARQLVADNYVEHLSRSMAYSSYVFGDLVRKELASIGVETPWVATCN